MIRHFVIYGDSISTVNHGGGGFVHHIERESLFDQITNFAISASGLTPFTQNCMADLVFNQNHFFSDASLILIWHGTNDWYYGTPINEYKKWLFKVHQRLHEKCPNAQFLFLSPIFRFQAPLEVELPGNAFFTKNRSGHSLIDYEQTLKAFALDVGEWLINMNELTKFQYENAHLYYEDMIHPNQKGYEIISQIIIQSIKKLQEK